MQVQVLRSQRVSLLVTQLITYKWTSERIPARVSPLVAVILSTRLQICPTIAIVSVSILIRGHGLKSQAFVCNMNIEDFSDCDNSCS
jgi:hypothetical protein